jgi:hypothetical protein
VEEKNSDIKEREKRTADCPLKDSKHFAAKRKVISRM